MAAFAPTRRSFLTGGRDRDPAPPVSIGDACFAKHNVLCQSCADVCETRAIRFRPRLGQPPLPELILDNCTLCGDCVPICPASAIAIAPPQESADG